MFSFDRQKQIIEILEKDQSLSVTEMSKRLFASASTIRRDLNELEKQGILQRVHGGAVLLSGTNYDPPAAFRKYHNLAEKQRIADLAERFLSPSSAYFFDSSSTATVLATRLEKYPNVRIVKNGIEIPSILQSSEKLSVISCGGSLRSPWGEFTGGITIKTIEEMNADVFFFSCGGFSLECGATEFREDNVEVKMAFLRRSKLHILLCDSSKFDTLLFYNSIPLDQIDYIVTNQRPPEAYIGKIRGKLIY